VYLVVVITVDFGTEDLSSFSECLNVFSGTSSYQPILEPAIRSFDLTFSLRRERIARFDMAFSQNLFPLGIDVIGLKIVFAPERITTLNEPENG